MANTEYITSNKLTEESNAVQAKAKKIVLILTLPIVIIAFYFNSMLGGVALILAVILYFIQKGSSVIEAGAAGEDIALSLLKALPDDFTIFNQVDIPNSKSPTGFTEADLIISGPNAVFVIEVKHNNGDIECDESNPQWAITKTGRGGTQYDKEMRNPIKQVKTQVWLLSEYFKSKRANTWIQSIVVFTNPEAVVNCHRRPSIPVLTSSELVDYIIKFKSKSPRPVRESTFNAIVALKKQR